MSLLNQEDDSKIKDCSLKQDITDEAHEAPLGCLFARSFRIYQKVKSHSASDFEIKTALNILERCNTLTESLGLYHTLRETLELPELSSMDIRLLSIPFLQGFLVSRTTFKLHTRKNVLIEAQQYYKTFLSILNSYSQFESNLLLKNAFSEIQKGNFMHITSSRDVALEKMGEEKALEKQISELMKHNKANDDDDLDLSFSDENELRKLNILQLHLFALSALTELCNISRELNLLEAREKSSTELSEASVRNCSRKTQSGTKLSSSLGKSNITIQEDLSCVKHSNIAAPCYSQQSSPVQWTTGKILSNTSSLSPFLATRAERMENVFKPVKTWTYSLEQEQQMEAERQFERISQESLQLKSKRKEEEEEEEEGYDSNEDSDEKRQSQMEMDEWKDDHPTGYGNKLG
ncbi:putative TAP42-like family [Monocercomonoides exilis]|uniref:putative TAP42-like family n=1 Tax=Monocercomonoides exilis TaxID=2049356 RepID=UPI00355A001E|nr:putative TAP42-like family [Monocercomonoides exilis]